MQTVATNSSLSCVAKPLSSSSTSSFSLYIYFYIYIFLFIGFSLVDRFC